MESSWMRIAAWSVILGGVALRLHTFLAVRSLRRDEANLTLNLVERSFADLLRPLDHAQGAAIGFLMLEKTAITTLGHNELALRLVPLLAGLVSLPLFLLVARRVLGLRAALVALVVVAISEPMVYYSSEVKQYSLDVMIGLAILAVAASVRGGAVTVAQAAWLAAVGAAAVWFSHPALFILGGVGLALLLPAPAAGGPSSGRRLAVPIVAACWAASFLANDFFFLRHLRRNRDLLDFWSSAFMPFPPRSTADLKWYLTTPLALFKDPVGFTEAGVGIAVAVFVLGCLFLSRVDRRSLALLVTPILLALLASGLRSYPFSGRLLLFAVPLLAMVVAAGFDFVGGGRDRERRVLAAVLLAVLLLHPALSAARFLVRPLQGEELKAVLQEIDRRRRGEDAFYLYFASEPAFRFYSRHADQRILPDVEPVVGTDSLGNQRVLANDVRQLAGRPRVWFVLSHVIQGDEGYLRHVLDEAGQCLDRIELFGASAYLYDLSRAPASPRSSFTSRFPSADDSGAEP